MRPGTVLVTGKSGADRRAVLGGFAHQEKTDHDNTDSQKEIFFQKKWEDTRSSPPT